MRDISPRICSRWRPCVIFSVAMCRFAETISVCCLPSSGTLLASTRTYGHGLPRLR